MNPTFRVTAVLAVVIACPRVQAGDVSFSQVFPLADTPWVEPVNLPPFDPALGVLEQTVLRLEVHVEGAVAVENLLNFPAFAMVSGGTTAPFELVAAATFNPLSCNWIPDGGGPPTCQVTITTESDAFVSQFDGVLDYAGASAHTFAFSADMAATAATTIGVNGPNLLTGAQALLDTYGLDFLAGGDGVVWTPIAHRTSAELTVTYVFGASAWAPAGDGLAGLFGEPLLVGTGTLVGGTPVALALSGAPPLAPASLFVGLSALNVPFKGGVLVPDFTPPGLVLGLAANGAGAINLGGNWPLGVPGGTTFYFQYWIVDPGGPQGLSASNAVVGTAP